MLKRIMLFMMMNIAVIAVITIVFAVLQNVFGISLDLYGFNYTSIFIYALIVGFTGSFISLAISKWMAKRAYKIQLFSRANFDSLGEKEKAVFILVEELAERNKIKIPEVGIYISAEPNAFATGSSKNNSLVAVSSGLLQQMNKGEIEGVVAHEMAHIINGDMVTMALLQGVLNTFVVFIARIVTNVIASVMDEDMGAIAYFAINIFLQIVLGVLASMVAMKFSRYREFKADAGSAQYIGKEKMIAALQALKKMQSIASGDNSELATMKISTKKRSGFGALLSSHPDLDDRIKALEDLRI